MLSLMRLLRAALMGLVKNAKNADVVRLLIRLEEEVQVVSSKHPKLPKMY